MWLHAKYKPYATDTANGRQPSGSCLEEIEREFWRSTNRTPPVYGADTEATLFDGKCKVSRIRVSGYLSGTAIMS